MAPTEQYTNERLDHLGIVAGVCQEIGLAAWLDAQDPSSRQQVSMGTATVAMILNGLGFSNRQLYLVPQFLLAVGWRRSRALQGNQLDALRQICLC